MIIAERAGGLRSACLLRGLGLRVFLGALAALCAVDASAADRYEGIAYVRGTDRVAYRETDWLFERSGVAERLTLYRCPGGAPFARKHVRDVPSATAPDFDFEDARDGYREGVRGDGGARQIFVQESAHAPLVVKPLPARPGAVLDAGFDAYVRAHWRELSAGDALRFPFLIPSHFDYLELKISSSHDAVVDGRPVRQLRMGLAAWYGFAIPSIALTYDRDGHRLQEFQGIGTVRDAAGHNQNVRIVFPDADYHSGVPEDEVDRAAAQPLATECGG
jgi:hypothetical protein